MQFSVRVTIIFLLPQWWQAIKINSLHQSCNSVWSERSSVSFSVHGCFTYCWNRRVWGLPDSFPNCASEPFLSSEGTSSFFLLWVRTGADEVNKYTILMVSLTDFFWEILHLLLMANSLPRFYSAKANDEEKNPFLYSFLLYLLTFC